MPEPTKIPRPFADSGDKNSIPESSGALGFASWQEGFPAITGTPFAQGGVAPKRADFNGIFNALSLATLWQQQGGFYAYDATTDYEVGNVVEYNNDLYKCITANGPSSAVKAPTDATVWSKVMTAADTAAVYFPLSGGTLSGNLTISQILSFTDSGPVINSGSDTRYLRLGHGTGSTLYSSGSSLYLYAKNNTTNPGAFILHAYDGANRATLEAKPDGTLTWDGKSICVLGTKVQTGTAGSVNVGANSNKTFSITFDTAYASAPKVFCGMTSGTTAAGYGHISVYPTSVSATGFTGNVACGDTSGRTPTIWWLAVGD